MPSPEPQTDQAASRDGQTIDPPLDHDSAPSRASTSRRGNSPHPARPTEPQATTSTSHSTTTSTTTAARTIDHYFVSGAPDYTVTTVYVDGEPSDNPPSETWHGLQSAHQARSAPNESLISTDDVDASSILDDLNPVQSSSAPSGTTSQADNEPDERTALHRRLANPSRIRNTDTAPRPTVPTTATRYPNTARAFAALSATLRNETEQPTGSTTGESWRRNPASQSERGLFPGEGAAQNALGSRLPPMNVPPPRMRFRPAVPIRRSQAVDEAANRAYLDGHRQSAIDDRRRRQERRDATSSHADRVGATRPFNAVDRARRSIEEESRREMELFLAGRSDDDDDNEDDDEDDDGMDVDDEGEGDEFLWEWTAGGAGGDDGMSGMFSLSNRSREDLPAVGGSGATLRRGGNNRNRFSRVMSSMTSGLRPSNIRETRPSGAEGDAAAQREDPQLDDANGEINIDMIGARNNRPTGLYPTNTRTRNDPVVVKSSQEGESGDNSGSRKKRKCVHYADSTTDEIKYDPPPSRPTYLEYTNLHPSVPLPSDFLPPPPKYPRISLSTHSTPSTPPRPCITFTYSPIPDGNRGDKYAQALRTTEPIPVECGVHYYEVEVLDAGKCGYMSVGWCKKNTNLDRLVGWEKGSWGWHGDDGMSFDGCGQGSPFGEGWGTGDVVGCGIDFTTGRAFFVKNGKFVGDVFSGLGEGIHPSVGLRTPRESVTVNFTGPFKYDIDAHVRKLRDKIWSAVLADDTDSSPAAEFKIPVLSGFSGKDIAQPLDLPARSRLQDPREMVNAAFVMDHLRQTGSGALSLLRKGMQDRKLIRQPSTPMNQGRVKTEHDETATVEEFETVEMCLNWVKARIERAHTLKLPLGLIEVLLTPIAVPGEEREMSSASAAVSPSAAKNGIAILDFLALLRQSDEKRKNVLANGTPAAEQAVQAEADDLDMSILSRARTLKEESKGWTGEKASGDKQRLSEAIGLIGLPTARWTSFVASLEWREEVAERVVDFVRASKSLKTHSHLAQAFSQTSATYRLLAASAACPPQIDGGKKSTTATSQRLAEAAFVDPLRILRDPGSVSSRSGRSGSIKSETEGDA